MKSIFIFAFLFSLFCLYGSQPRKTGIIHVFVALCDNKYQGIVPVPSKLGNGDDPANNLYWGAMYGLKTFLKNSKKWKLTASRKMKLPILERSVFKHVSGDIFIIADAYRGKNIKRAVSDFFRAASGKTKYSSPIENSPLIVYIGHDALMDFSLKSYPRKEARNKRNVVILACQSKKYFHSGIKKSGAYPLVWTTNFMAPEAYILEAVLEGWIKNEISSKILLRAAKAYSKYQKCSLKAAQRLFVSGF